MKTSPTISIVTTCLNHGHLLEQAIKSIFSQDYPHVEYIVIDGGSSDNTAEVIDRYRNVLAYAATVPGTGQYEAINMGFEKARGEVFAWLNADDYYCPWTFSTVGAIMDEVSECAWMTTLNKILFDAAGHPRLNKVKGYSRESFLDGRHSYGGSHSLGGIQQESTFWRKELWERAGGLNEDYPLAGDFELWTRFYTHATLYATVSPMGGPRLHELQRHLVHEESYIAEVNRALAVMQGEPQFKWGGYNGESKTYTGHRLRRNVGVEEKWYAQAHQFSG
jgi:glycosyltransferase involved in cell wall biosynthesis